MANEARVIGGRKPVFLCGMAVVCGVLAGAAAPARGAAPEFVCTNGDATRAVAVVREPGFACRVAYTRGGAVSYPWNARNEAGYCRPKALELVERLRGLGWACASRAEVESVLDAQIDGYARYIRILQNVGKTCRFYPAEAEYGDLCGDARDEAAIVYSCDARDGGWDQHLAVFVETVDEPLLLEVGGSGYRRVSGYHFDRRRLVLETGRLAADAEPAAGTDAAVSIECRRAAGAGWELVEP